MGSPSNIPYDEYTFPLAANNAPFNVDGEWNYVEVLDTTSDVQEVSFNGGQSWTKLRKGILVRIDGGTNVLRFRNPSGVVVTLKVAVGFGDITDARLIVDGSQGTVPTTVTAAAAPQYAARAAGTSYLENHPAAAASDAVRVTAAANVNGVLVHAGAHFTAKGNIAAGSGGLSKLEFSDAGGVNQRFLWGVFVLAGGASLWDTSSVLPYDILIPAGKEVHYVFGGDASAQFVLEVL